MKATYNLKPNSIQEGKYFFFQMNEIKIIFRLIFPFITDAKRPSVDYSGTKKYTLDEAIYLAGFNKKIEFIFDTILMPMI